MSAFSGGGDMQSAARTHLRLTVRDELAGRNGPQARRRRIETMLARLRDSSARPDAPEPRRHGSA